MYVCVFGQRKSVPSLWTSRKPTIPTPPLLARSLHPPFRGIDMTFDNSIKAWNKICPTTMEDVVKGRKSREEEAMMTIEEGN